MCCSVLQCVAVCCSMLQCVTEVLDTVKPAAPACFMCCSVLQCVAVCCSVFSGTKLAECCSALQGVAHESDVLQCVAVCCSVLQCVVKVLQRAAVRTRLIHVHLLQCARNF